MRICKRCIQPDSRPGIYFNEDGVCGACLWEDEKKSIDWNSREKELQEIAKWAKNTKKGNYDCVIGVSGGKDSTWQVYVMKHRHKMKPLAVTFDQFDPVNKWTMLVHIVIIINIKEPGFHEM